VEALYDSSGQVYAWVHESGRIYGLNGANLAFITGHSLYSWRGRHIGWWQYGHIRDSKGYLALFTSGATNLGVARPLRAMRPMRPMRAMAPMKPTLQMKPMKPMTKRGWSETKPF
jgi:hypothetical protein